jgi:hypothetical protein
MRLLMLLICSLFTVSALAHEDHILGEGLVHSLFHALLFVIGVAVVVKSIMYFRRKID